MSAPLWKPEAVFSTVPLSGFRVNISTLAIISDLDDLRQEVRL